MGFVPGLTGCTKATALSYCFEGRLGGERYLVSTDK